MSIVTTLLNALNDDDVVVVYRDGEIYIEYVEQPAPAQEASTDEEATDGIDRSAGSPQERWRRQTLTGLTA